jgi:hypothetical protein
MKLRILLAVHTMKVDTLARRPCRAALQKKAEDDNGKKP